jgi:hypothetical protein
MTLLKVLSERSLVSPTTPALSSPADIMSRRIGMPKHIEMAEAMLGEA